MCYQGAVLPAIVVSMERAYAASFSGDGLLFTKLQERTISWSPDLVLPDQHFGSSVDMVDISLYGQEHFRNGVDFIFTWKLLEVLVEDTPNDGEETVTIPSGTAASCNPFIPTLKKGFNICPVAIKVSVSKSTLVLPSSIGIWTGIAFLQSGFVKGTELRNQCDRWSANAMTFSPLLRRLQPCPPNQLVANFDVELEQEDRSSIIDTSSDYEGKYMEYFHPNINVCYRQNV